MVDDYEPRTPQDDLDYRDTDIDPLSREENQDITKELHTDPHEMRDRLADNEDPDLEQSEDIREEQEDLDQET